METDGVLANTHGALGRRVGFIAARERGLSAAQIRQIGTDPELFEAFYREQLEDLKRFVARRVDDSERAADLTAEIFIAAIESASRFRGNATPRTWLYGIARVVVANDARQSSRRQAGEERLRGSALLGEDDGAQMDARIDAAAHSRHLYEAMANLPEGERAMLELVALDELPVTQAAAASGIRPVTARVRLHRARRKLRLELQRVTSSGLGSETELSAKKGKEEWQ